MAYVFEQSRKDGPAFTAMYKAENGRYRSAGTYDVRERAQEVAEESEQHARLRLAETSPADRATVTIREFAVKFLREHPVEPNTKQTYAQLLNPHVLPYIGGRRVAEISRETVHRLLTVVLPEAEASQVTLALGVAQYPAVAPYRLGHQQAGYRRRLDHVGGVELDELHVQQRRPGQQGQRVPVAGVLPGVRGDLECLADPAGGQRQGGRLEVHEATGVPASPSRA
jgi:hypothetical protein